MNIFDKTQKRVKPEKGEKNMKNIGLMPYPDEPTENGEVPEWVLAIRPNYERIRKMYLVICLITAVTVLAMEIIMYVVFLKTRPQDFMTSLEVYVFRYIILPSVLNFTFLGIAVLFHKLYKRKDVLQNIIPCLAMVLICTTSAAAHSIYSVTMALFLLPIFMASLYGDKRFNRITSCSSAVGLGIAVVFRFFSEYRVIDNEIVPETIAAYAILIAASLVASVLTTLLNAQKGKLFKATKDAQAARRDAQAANVAKSEFLANMSHEIRTPLNAVIGMTEMITRKTTEEEIRGYAGDIHRASNALLAIINDILDLSKIESGKIDIVESNYELGSLINDSYNMVAVRWREKGLTATVNCDPNLPRILYGDEYHLRQILVNLLSNAVKYTNEGNVELKVAGEENGDVLRLDAHVKDTGIGILEKDIPHLFDKFNRLDLIHTRKVEGSGLGLCITKQLVDLMNGTISVESTYGVGSTFTVRIPQKIVDRTPIGDIHTTYLDMHGDFEQYHQTFEAPDVHILVVDDVSINLHVIRRLLESTKINVDVAGSGKECLKKVCENKYDLILMDHMMPEMDGVETLKEMNLLKDSLNADVPVIMLTANAMLGARESYIDAGFVDYLSKPVRGARLENTILKYLPSEKVILLNGAEDDTQQSVSLNELRDMLPEIDLKAGISYCANDETFYRSMIVEFIQGERDKKLQALYEEKNWKNYQIEAHSLKSASKMIGLSTLAEESFGLERAAKEGDVDYIMNNHQNVLNHYSNVAETLSKIKN